MLATQSALTPPPSSEIDLTLTSPEGYQPEKSLLQKKSDVGFKACTQTCTQTTESPNCAAQRPLAVRPLCGVRRDGSADDSDSDSDEGERAFAQICRYGRKRTRRSPSLTHVRALSPQTYSSDEDEVRVKPSSILNKRVRILPEEKPETHLLTAPSSRPLKRRRSMVPETDISARQRCFDYLLTAIDAAWAEYCDVTSHAEAQLYMPCSPLSDFDHDNAVEGSASPLGACEPLSSASEQSYSQRVMRLKQRLLDIKYKTTDLLDDFGLDSSLRFWRYWDSVKYAAADLVETDEEEQDAILERLERGRFLC